MAEALPEEFDETEDIDIRAGPAPALPEGLPQDERYFTLFATAIRKCLSYKPKFGKGRGAGLAVQEFRELYQADPFYSWIGLDSPLMYAAHKAAGGMTSVIAKLVLVVSGFSIKCSKTTWASLRNKPFGATLQKEPEVNSASCLSTGE